MGGPDNEPRVVSLGRAFYQYSLDHPKYITLLMTYESKLHRYVPDAQEIDDGSYRSQCQRLSLEYGRIVTSAIEEDIGKGRIRTDLSARQLMLLLWGQVFGVLQIILMRKESFDEVYHITPEKLFEAYLSMVVKSFQ
jgi:hypothetical protein